MAEHRSSNRPAPAAPEARDVNINDIGQRMVDSTTTVLTAPDGTIATVHLAWIMTLNPMDENSEPFITDENGVIGEQDRELIEDGSYVLSHGCTDRDFYHVEADPAASRGYAVASAANYLIGAVNASGYKVEPPAPPAQDGTPDFHKAPSSQGAIPNSDVKPTEDVVKQNVTETSEKK